MIMPMVNAVVNAVRIPSAVVHELIIGIRKGLYVVV
jgi:hypothetical protein